MRWLPATLLLVLVPACSHASTAGGPHGVSGRRASQLVARGAVLLDVRTEVEFFVRHLEGARNIPVGELAERADELGERDTPIVVYCMSGHRSAEAVRLLRDRGFTNVHDAGSMFSYGGDSAARPHRTAR